MSVVGVMSNVAGPVAMRSEKSRESGGTLGASPGPLSELGRIGGEWDAVHGSMACD